MRKNDGTLPATRPTARPRSAVDDPALLELLDHLGRLIAKEYVALLRKDRPACAKPAKGERP